jgi:hypothetical protein
MTIYLRNSEQCNCGRFWRVCVSMWLLPGDRVRDNIVLSMSDGWQKIVVEVTINFTFIYFLRPPLFFVEHLCFCSFPLRPLRGQPAAKCRLRVTT